MVTTSPRSVRFTSATRTSQTTRLPCVPLRPSHTTPRHTTPHNTTHHHTTQLHTTPLHSSPHHTTQLHTTPLHSTALLTTHHNTTYHDHHITLITPRSTRHTQATIASGWSCPGGSTFSSTPAASVAAARAAGCSVLQCTSSSCRCCDVPVNAVRATGSTLYQVCAFTSKG